MAKFADLPPELVRKIITYLDFPSVINLLLTARMFGRPSKEELIKKLERSIFWYGYDRWMEAPGDWLSEQHYGPDPDSATNQIDRKIEKLERTIEKIKTWDVEGPRSVREVIASIIALQDETSE